MERLTRDSQLATRGPGMVKVMIQTRSFAKTMAPGMVKVMSFLANRKMGTKKNRY